MKKRSLAYGLALGLTLSLCLGAYVTEKMFDTTYFSTSDTAVSLKGNLTNVFNGAGSAANWVASGPTGSTLSGEADAGSVVSTNSITSLGLTVNTPSAIQTLSAGTTVTVTASTMRVAGNGGAITNTATPSLQTNNIPDGTVITIRGTSDANTVTFQDYRTLTGTCIAMNVTSVTLLNGAEIRFQWSANNQRWQEISFSANSSQNQPFLNATVNGALASQTVTSGSYNMGASTVLTPVDAGTAIDLSLTNQTYTCILTGNVTFALSNITPGRRAQLLIRGCSTNSTISFASARWGAYPTVVPLTNMTRINIEGWVINGVTNAFLTGVNGN